MKANQILSHSLRSGAPIGVIGLGISGRASAAFILASGGKLIAIEKGGREKLEKDRGVAQEFARLDAEGAVLHFDADGEAAAKLLDGVKLAILSPGVSLESAIVAALDRRGIKLIGELELGIQLLGSRSIMVTGSNGKSTTVSLIHHILSDSGVKSFLCGNVGTPVISYVDLKSEAKSDIQALVVEVSSYQLESSKTLHPSIGVWLNISDNHLERHGTLSRYIDTKAKLFANQTKDDFAIVNSDDAALPQIIRGVKSNLIGFGQNKAKLESQFKSFALIEYDRSAGKDSIQLKLEHQEESYELKGLKLLGLHNRYNIAASILGLRLFGVSKDQIEDGLRTFVPLTHRIELVGEIKSNLVINDSKSTTVAASQAALRAVADEFSGREIVLMLGGLSKAGSWDPLISEASRTRNLCRTVVCFGRDRGLLRSHLEERGFKTVLAENVRSGLDQALKLCNGKQVILFSPGCASFDEFSNFEQRGEFFKGLVAGEPR